MKNDEIKSFSETTFHVKPYKDIRNGRAVFNLKQSLFTSPRPLQKPFLVWIINICWFAPDKITTYKLEKRQTRETKRSEYCLLDWYF